MFEGISVGTLDLEEARRLLPLAVATKGRDFVYRPDVDDIIQCLYVTRGYAQANWEDDEDELRSKGNVETPCLIGVVLDMRGDTWHRSFYYETEAIANLWAPEYGDGDNPLLTWRAAQYLGAAQTKQDGGGTWGEALDAAEAMVPGLMDASVVNV